MKKIVIIKNEKEKKEKKTQKKKGRKNVSVIKDGPYYIRIPFSTQEKFILKE